MKQKTIKVITLFFLNLMFAWIWFKGKQYPHMMSAGYAALQILFSVALGVIMFSDGTKKAFEKVEGLGK